MKFTVLPDPWPETIEDCVTAGHEYVTQLERADFLIFNGGADDFPDPMPRNIGFIQAAFAGVDVLNDAGLLRSDGPRWANAAGLFADTVAESAMGLLLAQLHMIKPAVQANSFDSRGGIDTGKQWLTAGKTVAIIGAGGIGRAMIPMLKGFDARVIAVNRSGRPVGGVDETVAVADIDWVWSGADYFVLAMPLTDETRYMVNAEVLAKMKPSAVVVNVGRGPLVNTHDLVSALRAGEIAGAALDVTDPEPLPDDHPLWAMPNCLITPHVANTPATVRARIGALAARNATAFENGDRMSTELDITAGY